MGGRYEQESLSTRADHWAFEEIKNFGPVLSWKSPQFKAGGPYIIYRTPFQKLPKLPEKLKEAFEQQGIEPGCNLSYGLDIWFGKKVFNMEWNENGHVDLQSFSRGDWVKYRR